MSTWKKSRQEQYARSSDEQVYLLAQYVLSQLRSIRGALVHMAHVVDRSEVTNPRRAMERAEIHRQFVEVITQVDMALDEIHADYGKAKR